VTAGVERVTVLDNGNVGIGTTNPSNILTIGNNTTDDTIVKIQSKGYSGLQILGDTANTAGEPGGSYVLLSTDVGITTGIFGLTQRAEEDGSGTVCTGAANNGLILGHRGTGTVQFSVNSDVKQTILSNGNVGIGTTNPTQKLHVEGNILSTGSTSAGTQFLGLAADTVGAPSFSWTGDTNTGMYRPGTDMVGLVTAGVERVSVLANGNVGIGTTNPQTLMHVQGTFSKVGEVSYDTPKHLGAVSWYNIGTFAGVAGNRLELKVLGGEGYNAPSFDKGGATTIYASLNNNAVSTVANVAGTFSSFGAIPAIRNVKFVQNSTNRNSYAIYAELGTFAGISIHPLVSNGGSFTHAYTVSSDPGANSATVQAAVPQIFAVNANVGIGTTNPQAPLHVNGDVLCNGYFNGKGRMAVFRINDPTNTGLVNKTFPISTGIQSFNNTWMPSELVTLNADAVTFTFNRPGLYKMMWHGAVQSNNSDNNNLSVAPSLSGSVTYDVSYPTYVLCPGGTNIIGYGFAEYLLNVTASGATMKVSLQPSANDGNICKFWTFHTQFYVKLYIQYIE